MAKEKQAKPAQTDEKSVDEVAKQKAADRKEKVSKISAELMTTPSFCSALTISEFIGSAIRQFGEVSIKDIAEEVRDECKKVIGGDMNHPEAILMAQAMSLSSIYNQCASLAGVNMINKLPQAEVLMRMALKAQAQCTQTLRVLGELKNPRAPATFVKQANIANGNQQVNNGPVTQGAHAHGEKETVVTTNELLTDNRDEQHAQTLDAGAKIGTSRSNQAVEAVGAVDGTGE